MQNSILANDVSSNRRAGRTLRNANLLRAHSLLASCVFALNMVTMSSGFAQQTSNTVPQTYLGDSFYELYGVNWGFRQMGPNGGIFFNNGGFGGAMPPFGAFDPNAGANFGFGGGGPNGSFFLNFYAAQGNQRSTVSSASTLTLPNGGIGSIYDASARPFVTGVVPVVGSMRMTSPLDERLARYRRGEKPGVRDAATGVVSPGPAGPNVDLPPPAGRPRTARPDLAADDPAVRLGRRPAAPASANDGRIDQVRSTVDRPIVTGDSAAAIAAHTGSSATRGDLSVAEIRRRQAADDGAESAAKRSEVESLVAQARSAEAEGKPAVARIFYQQALRRAAPDQRADIEARLNAVAQSKSGQTPR